MACSFLLWCWHSLYCVKWRQLKAVASRLWHLNLRKSEMRTLWMQIRELHELPFCHRKTMRDQLKPLIAIRRPRRKKCIKTVFDKRWINGMLEVCFKKYMECKETKRDLWHKQAGCLYLLTNAKTNKHTYTLVLERQSEVTPVTNWRLCRTECASQACCFDIDKPLRRLTSCQTFTNT